MTELSDRLVEIAKDAGEEILKVYNTADFGVEYKQDDSPLTEADKRSNRVIVEGLKALAPDIPVISEESKDVPYEERKSWEKFWLVDPLDGTKEFVSRNGEFFRNRLVDLNPLAQLVTQKAEGHLQKSRELNLFCRASPGMAERAQIGDDLTDAPESFFDIVE